MKAKMEFQAELERVLETQREDGVATAYRVDRSPSLGWTVHLRTIGKELDPRSVSALRDLLGRQEVDLDSKWQRESYFLLSPGLQPAGPFSRGPQPDTDTLQELRPGSGIVRYVGGVPKGPAGTLTCFLSSEDGSDIYLLAAGHVVTDFWQERPSPNVRGSIYHNPKGFPSTNSTRFIGKMIYRSKPPRKYDNSVYDSAAGSARGSGVDIDIAIASVTGEFEWKQRTTCYGTFGEWPKEPIRPKRNQLVMKCGSEETHWTYSRVHRRSETVYVYGPGLEPGLKPILYEFRGQVILRQVEGPQDRNQPDRSGDDNCSNNYPKTSFAVPGDSGTMVVDYKTRRPLGMLIAGSILDGKYVMTPLRPIARRWKKRGYIFLRA